jgi:class 3 adenylate cyclase
VERPHFTFERQRGVVWVCDLSDSSQYLNDDSTADALEQFLPRLHWVSRMAVGAAGGEFIKWTGDGFLAWFKTPLQRNAAFRAAQAFEAAWNLTILVGVTGLGVQVDKGFRIRHGVAYEQDALITTLKWAHGESTDLIGRSVVLAFRLAGIRAAFPSIATQKSLAVPDDAKVPQFTRFEHRRFTQEERQRFFKGERRGTTDVYVSADSRPKPRSYRAILARAKEAIEEAGTLPREKSFPKRFVESMNEGPDWCSLIIAQYARFIREDVLGSLESVIPLLEKAVEDE